MELDPFEISIMMEEYNPTIQLILKEDEERFGGGLRHLSGAHDEPTPEPKPQPAVKPKAGYDPHKAKLEDQMSEAIPLALRKAKQLAEYLPPDAIEMIDKFAEKLPAYIAKFGGEKVAQVIFDKIYSPLRLLQGKMLPRLKKYQAAAKTLMEIMPAIRLFLQQIPSIADINEPLGLLQSHPDEAAWKP
jgi:hypothetical protein